MGPLAMSSTGWRAGASRIAASHRAHSGACPLRSRVCHVHRHEQRGCAARARHGACAPPSLRFERLRGGRGRRIDPHRSASRGARSSDAAHSWKWRTHSRSCSHDARRRRTHAGRTNPGWTGWTHAGRTHAGWPHAGWPHAGRTHTGRTHAGRTHAWWCIHAWSHSGRTHSGCTHSGCCCAHAGRSHQCGCGRGPEAVQL